MAAFSYPSSDLQRSELLLSLLGSFWSQTFSGRDLVLDMTAAVAREEEQTHLDLLETVASLSRLEVPVFHTDNWYLLVLSESDLIDGRLLKLGDGAVLGHQPGSGILYQLGVPTPTRPASFPLPADLVDVPVVYNRITAPSRTWLRGVDYVLEGGNIVFRNNPFADDLVAKRQVYDSATGAVVDRQVGVWVYHGQFDWNHIYQHWGYLLSLQLASSTGYRDLVNAILDALCQGTTVRAVQLAFAAATGIPLVLEDAETVELIQTDSRHLVIATDKHAYTFAPTATPLVAVGDQLVGGQALVDSLQIFDLNRGEVPEDLRFLTMGEGFLGAGYLEGLTFENKTVDLVVEENVDGKTRVSFELGGFAGDAEQFWDEVHARGVASGVSLANLLDQRASPSGEPTAGNLPPTVNPLEFLIANILRYHAFVVRIVAADVVAEEGLLEARFLRRIVPPWTAILILYELEITDEPLILDGPADDESAGYTEELTPFDGAEPISETLLGTDYITERVTARYVEGFCE